VQDATTKPAFDAIQAEALARQHYLSAGYTDHLGELLRSRYVTIDITGPVDETPIYRDAWQLAFRYTPAKPEPDTVYGYIAYIDGKTGDPLPGCDKFGAGIIN